MLLGQAAQEAAHGLSLVERVRALEGEAKALGKRAEASGDLKTALSAIRELLRIFELTGRLAGDLSGDTPTVNLMFGQEWTEMRSKILRALAPHPDARLAVVHALGGDRLSA
jgi:hypothetical protein